MKLTELAREELYQAAATTEIDLTNAQLVVGVSGGPDSLTLLHVLERILRPGQLIIAHLDHGLRPSSAVEAQRAAEAARGMRFFTERVDVAELGRVQGLSIEEAGRTARYDFLARVARQEGALIVAVGHHADDQAETILMHLLRGSGLAGLQGMRPIGRLPNASELWLWRPLLHVTREEIEQYAAEQGLEPARDESNADTVFLRNRLRHELLPILERYNPQIRRRLVEMADLVAADEALLQDLTDDVWRDITLAQSDSRVELSRERWRATPIALRRRILRRAIATVRPELRDMGYRTLEAARRVAESSQSGSLRADLPGNVTLQAGYESIYVVAGADDHTRGYPQLSTEDAPLALAVPGSVALADGWQITSEWVEAWSEEVVQQNRDPWAAYISHGSGAQLTVRPRRPGERIRPLGLGNKKKLKEVMIDRKIPVHLRRRWPIVANDEHVVWVVGHILDERARVEPGSGRVVRLVARPPDDPEAG